MQQRNVSFISCLLASYPNLHHPLYSEKLCYFVFSKLSTKGVVAGVATFLSTVLQVKLAILEKLLTLIQVLTSQYWFISALMKNNNLDHNRLFYSSPYIVEKAVHPQNHKRTSS